MSSRPSSTGRFFREHAALKWVLVCCAVVLLPILFAGLFDWNLARGPISRMITAHTGRSASIDGNLKVSLWSWTPTVDIEGFHIGNPPWAMRPVMFAADTVSVSLSLGRLLRGQLVLPKLVVLKPRVDLERDATGRASWELSSPGGEPTADNGKPARLPTVQLLVIRDGVIDVEDQVRKLTLTGSLSAGEATGAQKDTAFQLRLDGTLNAKPLKVAFDGGPLVNLNPDTPYDFTASIMASTIHVSTSVSILRPFDLSEFTAKLHLSGEDLADAYYLTSLALPNTAQYDITGDVHRTNALFRIDGLKGKIGSSDIEGALAVDTSQRRFALKGKLVSRKLDIADLAPSLGTQAPLGPDVRSADRRSRVDAAPIAAKPATQPSKNARLLPDADLQLDRVRDMDADVSYRAQSVTAPNLHVKQVSFRLLLDKGDLKIAPLSFDLDQGTVSGTVEIDARRDNPASSIDMRVDHVELSQFKSATATGSPLSGTLQGRLQVHGFGTSVHKLAATADGGLGLVIPHGQISEVIAELTGINVLKGLGLMVSPDKKQSEIRCGVMDFEAARGDLKAKTLFVDTTNVLIIGHGDVQLGSEAMNLSLQGEPKHLRFVRLRAPVSITGTLADPTIGIKPEKLALQTGAAVALGVLLTPVAAALAFIDPGLAKDANCAAVLAQQQDATSVRAGSEGVAPGTQ